MCACTEPVRTGIGAVCVEYGRPKWPITMLNHTHIQTPTHTYLVQNNVWFFIFGTLCSYDPLSRGFFFLGKPRKKRLASLARLMINRLSTGTSTGSECRSEKEKTPPRQAHQPRWQRYYWWTADVQVVGICHSSSLVSFVVHLQGWSEHPVSALMWVV